MVKTIKEKAKEYDKVIKVINDHESIVDPSYRQYFELGANYVLNEIENTIKDSSNASFALARLNFIIKQLKGE